MRGIIPFVHNLFLLMIVALIAQEYFHNVEPWEFSDTLVGKVYNRTGLMKNEERLDNYRIQNDDYGEEGFYWNFNVTVQMGIIRSDSYPKIAYNFLKLYGNILLLNNLIKIKTLY